MTGSNYCPRLVVVDDDQLALRGIQRVLRRGDYTDVHVFESSLSCARFFDEHRCDLLIADYRMPEIDGLELVESVLSHEPKPAIIIVTGEFDASKTRQAFRMGVSDVVFKPFEPVAFLRTVRFVLEERKSQAEMTERILSIRHLATQVASQVSPIDPSASTMGVRQIQEGDLLFLPPSRIFYIRGESVKVTLGEQQILEELLFRRHEVVSQKDLARRLRGTDVPRDTAKDLVKQHIRRLRLKIERDPGKPEYIHTAHGVGYRLEFSPIQWSS